jgi:hypothetical protein
MPTPVSWLAMVLAVAPATAEPKAVRGNEAFTRRQGAVFSVAAMPRIGVLVAGGADVIQPVGFGAGLGFSVHGLHLGPLRFGAGLTLGHTRFLERRTVIADTTGVEQSITRYAALSHTDFTLGPSLQLVLGPVFLQGDFGAGLGISTFVRPRGPFKEDEEEHTDVTAAIRGVGSLGIPIRNNSSLLVGAGVHRYFSRLQIAADPPEDLATPSMPDTNPFDLLVEIHVGYHFSF